MIPSVEIVLPVLYEYLTYLLFIILFIGKLIEADLFDAVTGKEEPETTLPTGYEWWCFEGAILNHDFFYVLYKNNEAIRCGVENRELDVRYYGLYSNKEQAIRSFGGIYYQIYNLSELPMWAR